MPIFIFLFYILRIKGFIYPILYSLKQTVKYNLIKIKQYLLDQVTLKKNMKPAYYFDRQALRPSQKQNKQNHSNIQDKYARAKILIHKLDQQNIDLQSQNQKQRTTLQALEYNYGKIQSLHKSQQRIIQLKNQQIAVLKNQCAKNQILIRNLNHQNSLKVSTNKQESWSFTILKLIIYAIIVFALLKVDQSINKEDPQVESQIQVLISQLNKQKMENIQLKFNMSNIIKEGYSTKQLIRKMQKNLTDNIKMISQLKKKLFLYEVQPLIAQNSKISLFQQKYLQNLVNSLKILKQMKLQPNQEISLYTQIMKNISQYYKSNKKYKQLISHNNVLKIYLQQNKQTSQKTYLSVLQQIAFGYEKTNNLKQAMRCFLQMIKTRSFYRDDVSSLFRGRIFGSIGKGYEELNQKKNAIHYYNKALEQLTNVKEVQKHKNSQDLQNKNKIQMFIDYLKKSLQKIQIQIMKGK